MRLHIASLVTVALLIAAPGAHADLIHNGGFETGDFTDWTTGQNSYPEYIVTSPVHSGTYAAQIAGYLVDPDTLSQAVADTAGVTYKLTFWLYDAYSGGNIGTVVSWDNVAVLTLADTSHDAWQEFTVNVTGSGSDTLLFSSWNDNAFNYLDDVSLNAASVPEPGTLALFGMAILALGGLSLRRKFV